MPRVNLGKPPADDIMGLFLERKRALKLTNADMAKYLGCSSATFSRLLDTNTVNWKLCDIFKQRLSALRKKKSGLRYEPVQKL